ncbi:MAG: ferredoxin [Clostridiaceae bacterium]|jgi:ferredoxin|nr:ferredoxin [Clostridiaceae bacterium]
MKASVDHDLCIGCGLCESICPQVFEMGDDGLAHVIGEVTPDLEESAEEARESCPTEAITIE